MHNSDMQYTQNIYSIYNEFSVYMLNIHLKFIIYIIHIYVWKVIIGITLHSYSPLKNVKCHPLLLDLKRENAELWAKLDWYKRIEAKELGETYFKECTNTNFILFVSKKT